MLPYQAKEQITDRLHTLLYKKPSEFAKDCLEAIGYEKPSKDQRKFLDDLADLRLKRIILSAPRSVGKTMGLALLTTWSISELPKKIGRPFSVCVLGGKAKQAEKLQEYCEAFLYNLPYLKKKIKKVISREITLVDGSRVMMLAASERSVHGPHCYDEKTEILTENGFKFIKNLKEGEKVATLNGEGYLEFQKPLEIIAEDYKGLLFSFRNSKVDFKVTPNHHIFLQKQNEKKFKLTSIFNIKKTDYFKTTVKWKGVDEPHLKIGDRLFETKEFLKFLGYYLSEGSLCKGDSRIKISQSQRKHPTIYSKIKENLERLEFNFSEEERGFRFVDRNLREFLKQFGTSKERFIPKGIKILAPEYLTCLFEALVDGDGWVKDGGFSYGYSTSSERLKDDIIEIGLKLGFAFSTRIIPKHQINIRGHTYFASKSYQIYFYRKPRVLVREDIDERNFEDYSGKVYCVKVPNRVVFIRRNGKGMWNGNSDMLIIDEAADAKDDIIKTSFQITQHSDFDRIILSSTPYTYGYFRIFCEIWRKTQLSKKKSGWTPYHWKFENAHWIPKGRMAEKREELKSDPEKYRTEIEGLPTAVRSVVFEPELVRPCISEEEPEYIDGERTSIGVDWGFGASPTAVVVIQNQKGKWVVLFTIEFFRKNPDAIHEKIKELVAKYKPKLIFGDAQQAAENWRLRNSGIPIRSIAFQYKRENKMVPNLRRLMMEKKLIIPERFDDLLRQMGIMTYATKSDGSITSKREGVDTVDALMLALSTPEIEKSSFRAVVG